jgi:hypothetical protein
VRLTLVSIAIALAALAAAPPAGASEERIVLYGPVQVREGETSGDVFVVDGEIVIDGHVDGYLVSLGAPVVIRGRLDGDVWAFRDRVFIERGAVVDGDVYYGDEKPVVETGARVTSDVQSIDLDNATGPLRVLTKLAVWIAVSISSLALGLLFLWFAPRVAQAALWVARTRPSAAAALGVGLAVGLPLATVLALVTLVGIPLGIAFLLSLLPLYALAYVTGAWLLGRAILKEPHARVPAFLLGWAMLRLVAFVPFLGLLAACAATVFGLGTLAIAAWRAREERASVGVEPAV